MFQLADACLRELKEETGLDISISNCLNGAMSTLALWEASSFNSFSIIKVPEMFGQCLLCLGTVGYECSLQTVCLLKFTQE